MTTVRGPVTTIRRNDRGQRLTRRTTIIPLRCPVSLRGGNFPQYRVIMGTNPVSIICPRGTGGGPPTVKRRVVTVNRMIPVLKDLVLYFIFAGVTAVLYLRAVPGKPLFSRCPTFREQLFCVFRARLKLEKFRGGGTNCCLSVFWRRRGPVSFIPALVFPSGRNIIIVLTRPLSPQSTLLIPIIWWRVRPLIFKSGPRGLMTSQQTGRFSRRFSGRWRGLVTLRLILITRLLLGKALITVFMFPRKSPTVVLLLFILITLDVIVMVTS